MLVQCVVLAVRRQLSHTAHGTQQVATERTDVGTRCCASRACVLTRVARACVGATTARVHNEECMLV